MTLEIQDLMSEWVIRHSDNGLTPIPINTKTNEPKVKYSQYVDEPLSRDKVEEWINQGLYKDGVAILTGKCHIGTFRGLYINCVDFDNPETLEKLTEIHPLEQLANNGMFCEQHSDNKGKAHVWVFSNKPFPKLSSKDDNGLEVKSDGVLCNIFPSMHKSGNRYFPIGNSLKIFTDDDVQPLTNDGFINIINKITDGHYLNGKANKNTSRFSIDTSKKIPLHQRHTTLVSHGNSLYAKLKNTTPLDLIKKYFMDYAHTQCEIDPKENPDKREAELEQIWNDIVKFQEENNNSSLKQEQQTTENAKILSVLEAKRLHGGQITVRGNIVSVSNMYILEIKNDEREYRNAKSIQLEDTETLDDNDRLDVTLYDDNIERVIAGETVQITGIIRIEDKKPNTKSKKRFGVLHADSIQYLSRKEILVTDTDIESFKKFTSYPNPVERLTAMFAPNIIGRQDEKRGSMRAIVGGVNRGKLSSGRIDTLMVGDSGTAKSALGAEACEIKPNSRHVSAPHGTTKTITAVPEKINEIPTLVLGAIPLSRGAICAIDEINSWSIDDQGRLLDVMQDGAFDVDKMGIRRRISSPTTIIGTLNPVGGKWNDPKVATTEEFNLRRSFVDRISQIYTSRDNMNEEQIDGFISDMDVINERKPHNYNFLRKYLIYASNIKDVKFTKEAKFILNNYWKQGYLNRSLTIRMYKSLYKIAEAQAKLQLKDIVDKDIALQTIQDFDYMMAQYDKAIGKIFPPQEVAYKLCLDILQESDSGMTIEEMCRIVVHRDRQVGLYLGNMWQTRHNHKLRIVVDSLLNNPNVKKTQSHPMVLRWLSDTGDRGDTDSKCEFSKLESFDNTTNGKYENNNYESMSPPSPTSPRNEG